MELLKPPWLTIRPPTTEKFHNIKQILKTHNLHTVCEESHCPNIPECWSGGTATFMVMGDTCTRACRFCAVKTGYPARPLDPNEPENLAEAIKDLELDYIVITSVDRDDLPDQGAGHFAECIKEIRKRIPEVIIEVLIPDFRGNSGCIKTIVQAKPDVIAHNIETVRSLQRKVRDPRANYEQSLFVLESVKKLDPIIYTKSSIILGFGEKDQEVLQAMKDLRCINVDILTLGQYLRPGKSYIEVYEYVAPEKFEFLKMMAEELGFLYVASGPFVRSSYRAGELFLRNAIKNK